MDRIYINFAYDKDSLFGDRRILNREDHCVMVISDNPLPDSLFDNIIPKSYKNKKKITLIYKCRWSKYFATTLEKKLDRYIYYTRKYQNNEYAFIVFKGIAQKMHSIIVETIDKCSPTLRDVNMCMKNMKIF